jgi:argininosuccinate synthase
MERVVLAYAGGLVDAAVSWLAATYNAEVIAVTLDLGQGRELASVRERALAAGCVRAHVMDVRAEFADRYILPALQAGAIYEGAYPLGTALSRPLIASKLVDIARIEGATLIAHGCPGHDNDRVRLDLSVRALEPSFTVIAAARAMGVTRRTELNTDTNLWGRAIRGGVLDDPWVEAPAHVYAITADPTACPQDAAYVDVAFERGVPTAINGVPMPFIDIIGSLGTIAGSHGVGRIDMVEDQLVGTKSREIYEAPAAVVLHQAHRALETVVTTRDLARVKHDLSREYADLVYNGLWYSPLRQAIDAFVAKTEEHVTGAVRVKLFGSSSTVVGRMSPFALSDDGLAAGGESDGIDRESAEGFIKVRGLLAETLSRRQHNAGKPEGTV